MFSVALPILAPVLLCILAGYLWKRLKQPYDTDLVSRLVMTIGAPALVLSTLATAPVSKSLLSQMVVITACLLLGFAASGYLLLRLFKLDVKSYLGPVMFPNEGNMGLPLCLFAFGEQGLALGLAIFMLVSLVHFSLGIVLVSGGSFFEQLVTNPVIYSLVAAGMMVFFDIHLPEWVYKSLHLLGSFTIPLMLITLGVSLASLRITQVGKSSLLALMRLGVGVGVGALVCWWFELEGVQRGVVMLQAMMPTAVFNYLFAHRYNRQPEVIAGMVVISTFLAFVTLPFIIPMLRQY